MATIKLNKQQFKTAIFDYEKHKSWKFEGDKPALIDFYADWCGPCKMIAPLLEELSDQYSNEISIYKLDTEAEPEIAGMFGIRSIPSLLFIPLDEEPQMVNGALPKNMLERVINEVLLKREMTE